MMLFKLSLKNIKKSFKDYAIYFFTLILGVAIFYVFNAIDSQTVMMDVTKSTRSIIELMTNMLSGVSVFVSFILGFLIIYASRFLIKRRKKEFGIYLTLGMSKRKISMILFFETILIGFLSLGVGLFLGVLLSQGMSLLVANMFEADLTKFSFVFSLSACIKTLLYFSIMYILVMLFNTISISKCKLIDLLHGSKQSEKVYMKNPHLSTLVFLISVTLLGYAYYMVTGGINETLEYVDKIFIPIILGIVSTYGIFWSLSGLLLHLVQKSKSLYYKGLNSFTLRQISSKVNTTVFSMTIICLMLFVTICVLSSALSIKNSMTANLKSLAPIDVEFYKQVEIPEEYIGKNKNYTKEVIEDSKLSMRETLEKLDIFIDNYFQDILEVEIYATDDITIEDTLGNYLDIVKKEFPYLKLDAAEEFMKISDYNKIARFYHLEEYTLESDEYLVIADFASMVSIRNGGLKENTTITLLGKTYHPKYSTCQNGFIHISSNHINPGIFLVPDEALDDSMKEESIFLANYKETSKEGKQETEEIIRNITNHPYFKNTNLKTETKLGLYESSIGLGAMVTFIGLYLGIIFLISSAAILALKELSESSDNKERFRMLRRIGADEKMIDKALFRQIAIFFLFPLLLAMIHSIFGIMFCNYILETLGNEKLLESIIMTSIFLVGIYGGYFIITYWCSKNIIKGR